MRPCPTPSRANIALVKLGGNAIVLIAPAAMISFDDQPDVGCATPPGSVGHAGATANLKLTFHLDHSAGADQ